MHNGATALHYAAKKYVCVRGVCVFVFACERRCIFGGVCSYTEYIRICAEGLTKYHLIGGRQPLPLSMTLPIYIVPFTFHYTVHVVIYLLTCTVIKYLGEIWKW